MERLTEFAMNLLTTLTQILNHKSNPNRLVFTFTGAMVKTIMLG